MWPPTIMINKATALEERHQTITWGAAQLGIAQGVLDAVADGLIPATEDVLVFVCVWVDPAASDETAVREANRGGGPQGDRRVRQRPRPGGGARAGGAARLGDEPVLRGRVTMRITAIRMQRLRLPLDPPFLRRLGPGSRAARSRRRSCGWRPTPAWSASAAATR